METRQRKCAGCSNSLTTRHQIKFCSNKCQNALKYQANILMWKGGYNEKKYLTKNISGYIKRYLIEKFKEKCSICGWNRINKFSNKIPLEVDHIDGNSENNSEVNLRLICPNCHALTPHFRNLNRGNGRSWRLKKERIK